MSYLCYIDWSNNRNIMNQLTNIAARYNAMTDRTDLAKVYYTLYYTNILYMYYLYALEYIIELSVIPYFLHFIQSIYSHTLTHLIFLNIPYTLPYNMYTHFIYTVYTYTHTCTSTYIHHYVYYKHPTYTVTQRGVPGPTPLQGRLVSSSVCGRELQRG